ncbi:hypothetical protein GCM10027422_13490 [Hymenobacter arcticus]
MKTRLAWLPAALGLLATVPALAQNELSNFSATGRGGVVNTFALDYQALGINPANLGRQGTSLISFTVGEVGAGVGSQSLTNSQFKKLLFHANDALSAAERTSLVANLNSQNALNINADATAFGLAVTLPPGLGGLAVSVRQRLSGHVALNQNSADIIVNGQQAAIVQQYYDFAGNPRGGTPPLLSAALDGTQLQLALTNEFNIGYGVEVLDIPGVIRLTAGVGYRYIQGIGVADVRIGGGSLSAYSSLSPVFDINYGSLASSPSFNYQSGSKLQPVGHGNGFDLGLAAEVGKVIRLGASVTDLGSMTWTGNVVTATDQSLTFPQYSGLATYDVVQNIVNQFGASGKTLFTYQTAQKRRADLPTKLRLGGGVRISELFEAGLDVTVPLNKVAGNLPTTFIGAGLDFKPVRWVRLSTGVSGGAGYKLSVPLGVTFVTPVWEAGISTRSVAGYFADNNPYASVALGFLRFKIGKS